MASNVGLPRCEGCRTREDYNGEAEVRLTVLPAGGVGGGFGAGGGC